MIRFIVPAMVWTSAKTGRRRAVVDGFYVQGKIPNWSRLAKYRAWKQHVREHAVLAGIDLPLRPTKEEPMYLVVACYFVDGVHADCGNVLKGLWDALCYVSPEERKLGIKGGSDKHTGGLFHSPRYDAENPRVEVKILSDEEFGRMCLDHQIAVMERVIDEIREESK